MATNSARLVFVLSVREHVPDFMLLETIVNDESHEITHEVFRDLLQQHDNLVDCYVTGDRIEGALSGMWQARLDPLSVLIYNEITVDMRSTLAKNLTVMAISTPLMPSCRRTRRAYGALDRRGSGQCPWPDLPAL